MEKIFAIGDIHGHFNKLVSIMDKIDIDLDKDTLVFIGDYIDRGPSSFEVVEYLIDLKMHLKNIVFLKGNHEDMLEKYLAGTDRLSYLANGGQKTLEQYLKRSQGHGTYPIPPEHLNFFDSLFLFYQTDDYIFVHAGLRKKVPLEMQNPTDLLWIRNDFILSDYDFGKRVIFGHTPFSEPLVQSNKIGIDTGAVYGNKLTCVELPELVFHYA